jgi:hypothetical protein
VGRDKGIYKYNTKYKTPRLKMKDDAFHHIVLTIYGPKVPTPVSRATDSTALLLPLALWEREMKAGDKYETYWR